LWSDSDINGILDIRRKDFSQVGSETEIGHYGHDCSEDSDCVSSIDGSIVASDEAADMSNKQGSGKGDLEHMHFGRQYE
jgi:hypothetical protein